MHQIRGSIRSLWSLPMCRACPSLHHQLAFGVRLVGAVGQQPIAAQGSDLLKPCDWPAVMLLAYQPHLDGKQGALFAHRRAG